MLIYNSHEHKGVLVLTVEEPEADDERQTTQREWLYGTIASRTDPRFIIDMSAINYMASSDVGFLITLKRRIDARKGRVVICRLDTFIHDLFRTMRLDKLLEITDTLENAVAKLAAPPS